MTVALQNIINALSLGSLYALLALGISLIFGIMGLVNFAHGELIMAGGYVLYLLTDRIVGIPLPGYLVVCVAGVALLALLMERGVFRPLRGSSASTLLVASFAVSYGLQNIALAIFGGLPQAVQLPAIASQTINVGGVRVAPFDLITIAMTALLLVCLTAFLQRTRMGVQMRAAAEDFSMARLLGVRADAVVAMAFLISGLLAGVVSFFYLAKVGTVIPTLGQEPVLVGLCAMVIGGMGNLVGAVVGGFVLGIITIGFQAYLPLSISGFSDAFVFGSVIFLLLVRPQGLITRGAHAPRV